MSDNIVLLVLVILASCCCARGFTYPSRAASFFDILNFELNFIENYERKGVGDFPKWKEEIQKSKDIDDNDLAEKLYNGLQTLIQEKIYDLPEVRYKSEYI